MNSFITVALLFCASAVTSAPSGPWASSPYVIAPQPIYFTKPIVSGWAEPAVSHGWAAPAPSHGWAAPSPSTTAAPEKKEETTTAAPAKKDEWAAPTAGWAQAPVASSWSSQVILKPAYLPLKPIKYIATPHYYVANPHSSW